MRREGGGAVPMIWSASPIRAGGKIVGILSTGIDLTEHARLEEQLRQAQKLESVGQLASGIAHDFNNLLTAILGNSNLLVDELRDNFVAEERVRHVIAASERAAALTGQLLAFSRKKVGAPKVVNLNRLVTDIMPMLRRLIRSDIEITFRACPDLGNALVDPNHFEQVLINLVVNARDAMPTGGVISIETDNVNLDETFGMQASGLEPGPHVMLAVSDTGVGMDDATRLRIFEPFFTTKEQGKGTGLGLATCYGIVKQAKGNIWVYSEPGRGTTFKVILPQVDSPVTPDDAARLLRPAPRGEGTILVAEDEEMVRRIVSETLRSAGYTVLEASDGLEALAVADRHGGPLHLLITDSVMPRMNGRQLYDQIRAGRENLRVLFMSGYTADASVRGGGMEPGVSFISKPFSPRQLLERVQSILSN
jgi:two-component system cell cycle sensor histidine kinase/response regulator CckA